MGWLHRRHVDKSYQETHRCIDNCCIPLRAGPAIDHIMAAIMKMKSQVNTGVINKMY